MVRNQESFNEMFKKIKEDDISNIKELSAKIAELMEGENRLWECLCK